MRVCLIICLVVAFHAPLRAQEDAIPEITIAGADEQLAANIRNYLRIGAEACDTALVRLNRLAPQVRSNIRRAAHALGYYKATFELAFTRAQDCWQLHIAVTPGYRIPVNEVSIHISGDEENQAFFEEVLAEIPGLEDQPLHHGQYESLKNTLSARAVENGYFSARFLRSEILLDLTAYQADIAIDFETGPRYRFGEIRLQPVPGLSEAFIQTLILLEPGEPYSSGRLLDQRQNLDESMYFSQINVSPQLSQASQETVPVIINLTPRLRHAYSTGVGFTTDTGPRVRADYQNRYLNRRGHLLNSDMAISPVRSQANASYVMPLSDPVNESISLATGVITEDTESYDSDRFTLETAYRRQSDSGWLETWSINYLLDDYTVNLQQDKSTLTMLGYSLSKRAGDDFINPSKGWRLFAQVRVASDFLLSDTTFVQLYSRGKGIISIGPGRIISRFELGTTWIEDSVELPASIRYFAGGDQSIRGYKYQALGPRNSSGEVVGGKHLATGSVEYDFPLRNHWRAALFFDGGNAFSSETLESKSSVGVGVRWLSPIGPIRVDFARALDDEGGFRLHITMGPDL